MQPTDVGVDEEVEKEIATLATRLCWTKAVKEGGTNGLEWRRQCLRVWRRCSKKPAKNTRIETKGADD